MFCQALSSEMQSTALHRGLTEMWCWTSKTKKWVAEGAVFQLWAYICATHTFQHNTGTWEQLDNLNFRPWEEVVRLQAALVCPVLSGGICWDMHSSPALRQCSEVGNTWLMGLDTWRCGSCSRNGQEVLFSVCDHQDLVGLQECCQQGCLPEKVSDVWVSQGALPLLQFRLLKEENWPKALINTPWDDCKIQHFSAAWS